MSGSPWRLVTVDIDGTLTLVHGWERIARQFGREADYLGTTGRFRRQEVGEDSHLAALLALAQGHTIGEVESVLAETPHLDGIREGIAALHQEGAKVALLTHNPPYVARWYAREFGFDDLEGTAVIEPAAGGPIPPSGLVHADKPGSLQRLTERLHVSPRDTVHVGDGWSDAELFPLIGGGVALNSPFPDVDRAADLALHVRDFRVVARAILGLPRRR